MSGRSSKAKGNRVEYLVRDYFRSLGFEADRVPSSGNSQGFKGDVRVKTPDQVFLIEVKARKSSYKSIYDLMKHQFATALHYHDVENNLLVSIAWEYKYLKTDITYTPYSKGFIQAHKRTFNKIANMQALVKDCELLVIKDNNKPLLFLRYL